MIKHVYEGKEFLFEETRTAPMLIEEIFSDNYKVKESGIKLGEGDTIFDIGANEGMFSVFMSHLFPEALIIAIEPVVETYQTLKKNLEHNRCRNVEAYCFGVGAPGQKEAVLNVSNDFSGGSSAKCTFVESDMWQAVVELASLDDVLSDGLFDELMQRLERNTVSSYRPYDDTTAKNLVKMDIEGMEYDALYGCSLVPRIKYFAGEFHINMKLDCEGRRPVALATWLKSQGVEIIHLEFCKMAE